jgi:hypothetical protein
VKAELFVALATEIAVVAECFLALVTNVHSVAIETKLAVAHYTQETVFAVDAEISIALIAVFEVFAVDTETLVALGTAEHLSAWKTRWDLTLFAMARVFALGAEYFAALCAKEHTLIAFWVSTNEAVAEMIPFGELVTAHAPSLANLWHFAVCALFWGASRHEDLSKSRTVIFAKASMQTKDIGKLLDRHESSNRSSVQRAKYCTAHEILRKYLGEKYRWRRRLLLRLLSTPFRFLSCHDDGDWFLDLS